MARLLLVEDEKSVLHTVKVLLSSQGHEIVPLSEGSEALRVLGSDEPIDLLVTDLRMSPVDGMEVLQYAHQRRPDMPIVVISAYCSDKTVEQCLNRGVTTYVKKPFKMDEVLDAVSSALARPTAVPKK